MRSKQLTLAATLLFTTAFVHASQATVNVQNKCDQGQAYKIDTKGSSLSTLLPPRTSKLTKLNYGDRIKVGNSVLHTVAASSEGKTVLVCTK